MSLTEVTTCLEVAVVDVAVAAVVPVRGELVAATAPALRQVLIETQASSAGQRAVVVDLSGVTFIDASGLGVLVAALKRARARHGELVLRDPAPGVVRTLELTRLATAFRIERTTG